MSDKKELILDHAARLFARHGFDATAVRAIAEASEVNIAMISYYFGSKENVLKRIIDRHGSILTEIIRETARTEAEPVNRLRVILRAYVDYSFSHPEPIIISQREMGVSNRPALQDVIHCYYTEINQLLFQTIREGQQAGIFREFDINLFMFSIGGMTEHVIKEIHTMVQMGLDPAQFGVSDLADPEFKERFFNLVWEIVETYLTRNVQHTAGFPAGSTLPDVRPLKVKQKNE